MTPNPYHGLIMKLVRMYLTIDSSVSQATLGLSGAAIVATIHHEGRSVGGYGITPTLRTDTVRIFENGYWHLHGSIAHVGLFRHANNPRKADVVAMDVDGNLVTPRYAVDIPLPSPMGDWTPMGPGEIQERTQVAAELVGIRYNTTERWGKTSSRYRSLHSDEIYNPHGDLGDAILTAMLLGLGVRFDAEAGEAVVTDGAGTEISRIGKTRHSDLNWPIAHLLRVAILEAVPIVRDERAAEDD